MFLALHKISNLDRNMISIFCLAFLQVFPRWLSWSSLSWSLRLQSRFLEERSWRKHTQDISALLSGTSSVAWEQYLFSSCQHCLRLCDFLHYRSCAKKKSVFYLWILSLLLITSRWSMSPSLLGQLFAPLGLRPIGLTESTGLTELTGTGTRLLKRF